MDKLKEFFGLFKRQHFWFVWPILLILTVVGWMSATGSVEQKVSSQKGEIDGYFSQATNILNVNIENNGHPNSEWEGGMETLIASRLKNVEDAWGKKWDRQKTLLRWPEELEFAAHAETLRPIEKIDPNAPDVRLGTPQLERYAEFIRRELPKLAEKIGSVWRPTRAQGSFSGGASSRNEEWGTADEEAESPVVEWLPDSQGQVVAMFNWVPLPDTLEVLYAQEDYWVLTALMDIIVKTNGGATTRSHAAIKELQLIQIGKSVQEQQFAVITPGPPPGAEASEDDDSGGGDYEEEGTFNNPEEEQTFFNAGDNVAGRQTVKRENPAKGRYVDREFKPIEDVAVLKASVDVAKRIPVRIRVRMDQREINKLLVNCANSSTTFEVRQMRLNPKDSFGVSRTSTFGRGNGESNFFSQSAAQVPDAATFDRTVELYGIIYIFNPVNKALLNGEAEAPISSSDEE